MARRKEVPEPKPGLPNLDKYLSGRKKKYPSKYHLADSMLRFISNPTGFGSEIHYVEERGDVEQ